MVRRGAARAVARTVSDSDEVIWGAALAAGPRSLAWAAGFWVLVAGLLAARVALFDDINAARLAGFLARHVAALAGTGG